MSNNNQLPNNESDKEISLYSWTSFPLIDTPVKTVILSLVVIFITVLLWQLTVVTWDQPLFYVLGMLILLLSLMPYFVPTTYFFYEDRFLVKYPFFKIEKPYSEYGCFYVDKLGIMLSTFKKPRKLDAFRGQSIRFSKTASERDEIISFLANKIGKQY